MEGKMKTVPEPVQLAITEALATLNADQNGDLRPGYRQQIRRAIWQSVPERGPIYDGMIEIESVRFVLQYWKPLASDLISPDTPLQEAGEILAGRSSAKKGLETISRLWWPMFECRSQNDASVVKYVLFAAIQVCEYCCLLNESRQMFLPIQVNFDITNYDLEYPVDWSPSFAASRVVCGGFYTHDPGFSRDKLRSFWSWWLNDAIPSVFDHHPTESRLDDSIRPDNHVPSSDDSTDE